MQAENTRMDSAIDVAFRYDLHELKVQMIDQKPSGLKVCPECMDIDHEQLQLGKFRIWDPEALKDPRPDTSLASSRDMGSVWDTGKWDTVVWAFGPLP